MPESSHFVATQWSLVLSAGGESTRGQRALSQLCSRYWYPIYAFARKQGLAAPDAEDTTQGFFMHILSSEALATVDRAKGRFRSFLLASMKNFLANEWDRARAAKRGGGVPTMSLDATGAEERYRLEPADMLSPDKLYDRRWALTVLDQTVRQLAEEQAASGKAALFQAVRPVLDGGHASFSYEEIGAQLGMSAGAVKVAVHRLRQRYRELLRGAVAETVVHAEDVDDELRQLIDALT